MSIDRQDTVMFLALVFLLNSTLERNHPYIGPIIVTMLFINFVWLLTKGDFTDIIDPQFMEERDAEVQEVAVLAATLQESCTVAPRAQIT